MRVGQRRSTLLGLLGANYLSRALFLFHGVEPVYADDLRFATQQEWGAPWGDHLVTKNGDPQLVPSIGATDDDAFDFDGVDDYLSVPDDATLDSTSSDDLAVVALVQRSSTASAETICQKWSGTVGYRLRLQADGTVDFVVSDGTNTDTASTTTAIDDEAPHLVTASIDRGGSQITIEVDGTREAAPALSAGDISNAADFVVADSSFSETVQATGLHGEWISEPQAAFLDALLRTGDSDPAVFGLLDTLVDGSRREGLSRSIPSYLVDAFGAGGPDFWSSADQHIHAKDGEGVVQLTNHAGSNFGVQRTASVQPIARGPSTRGELLDHLEWTGVEEFDLPDETGSITQFTVAGIVRRDLLDSSAIMSYGLGGNTGYIRLVSTNQNNLQLSVNDEDGVGGRAGNFVSEPTKRAAFVGSVDYSTGEVRGNSINEDGVENSGGQNFSFTNTLSPAAGAHKLGASEVSTFHWDGIYEYFLYDRGTFLDSNARQSLVQEIARFL